MPSDSFDDEMRERIERIIRQILDSDEFRESSVFSRRSYGDEPILRTGADLRREQDARERRGRQLRREGAGGAPARRHAGSAAGGRRGGASRAARPRPGNGPDGPHRSGSLLDDTYGEPASSAQDWVDAWRTPAHARRVGLPPTLRELRDVQKDIQSDGSLLRGKELFIRQAKVAADYEDDFDRPCTPSYRYSPSYRDLNNTELRDYFSWRTQWRHGTAKRMPFTYVRIAAAELVNGIGAEPGEKALAELQRLEHDSLECDAQGMGPNVDADLRQWIRDYGIYHHLDPKLFVSDDERAFAESVAVVRLAERDALAREGLRGLKPSDAPATPPDDATLWKALGALSSYQLGRSPFFRTHEEEAAAVGAGVFRRLALHCAKRRKVCLVDGLLGSDDSAYYTPFLGLPFLQTEEPADGTIRLTAAETVSHRFGRWRVKRGYASTKPNRDLGRLLRAIDRQMRIDWGFGHALKDRDLPKYLRMMIERESSAEHERVVEAERRKITIDLSQLKHIRSAAAKTRDALLVDEEREGFVPASEVADLSAAGMAGDAGRAADAAVPEPAAGEPVISTDAGDAADAGGATEASGGAADGPANPLGLTDLELSVTRRLLDGEPIDDLLGAGAPMASVLVDSINEKFFDEIGDSVIEFGDDGKPVPVEDYVDDVRGLLG